MTLARLQQRFLAQVIEDEAPLPPDWDDRFARGLDIYRNAYRARLVAALEETFPRTARWVGEDAFGAAAAHHLITHPPRSWTLDAAGEGFAATLAELFANDPEVAELAWLESAMHEAFVAADAVPLNAPGFARATAGFGAEDWADMRIAPVPSFRLTPVDHDCVALWRLIGEDTAPAHFEPTGCEGWCIVWREGLRPVCRLVSGHEARALLALFDGASYGEICADLANVLGEGAAAQEAGALLGRWLALGIVATAGLPRGACISSEFR